MTSPTQISSNRHNAQLSTGPRTEPGKAAASQNARKHGLASGFSVLSDEDQTEFDDLLEAYRNEFGYDGEHESFLVDQMAQSRWKLARIQRLETAALEREDWKALAVLQRYTAATERSYYRAHRELLQGRKQAKSNDAAAMTNFIDAYINAPMPGRAPAPQAAPVQAPPTHPVKTADGHVPYVPSTGSA